MQSGSQPAGFVCMLALKDVDESKGDLLQAYKYLVKNTRSELQPPGVESRAGPKNTQKY